MAQKELYGTPRPDSSLSLPQFPGFLRKTPSKTLPEILTTVKGPKEIPQSILDYFQIDPRTRQELSEEERILQAQVFMHEIEEGARLLGRSGHNKDAQIISDFSNNIYPSQRLDLLRRRWDEIKLLKINPERVQNRHKARNNQWGAIKTRLGPHPAVAYSEVGIGYKEINEDGFLLMSPQKTLALADGLGGHPGGDVASCIAIDFFEFGIHHGLNMEQAITYANEAIIARSHSDPELGGMHPMGCTFVSIQLRHSLLRIAYVGDSKVLVLRDGKILFETADHTKGQELLREGLVDTATAFELNHILSRCLGLDRMQAQRDVARMNVELEPGDRILMTTDGITDNFFDEQFGLEELAQMAFSGSPAQGADAIVDACHQRMLSETLPSGRPPKPDNISLALLEFRG